MALKGSDTTFRELILSSLASRTRRLVDHELANGIPANQREILDARRAITDLALDMAGRGEIELNPIKKISRYSPEDRALCLTNPIRTVKPKRRQRRRFVIPSRRAKSRSRAKRRFSPLCSHC